MSYWTHIMGTIKVTPLGRTQEEIEYIIKTVIRHLPKVTGSEEDMYVHIEKASGYNNFYSSHNEFGEPIKNEMQDVYFLLVEGNFRDRMFDETYEEFQNWLCRLAKRVLVYDVIVNINDGFKKSVIITNKNDCYTNMFEYPSWSRINDTNEPTWCEYLMWRSMKNEEFPAILGYKYINDKENDKRVEDYLGIKYDD